MTVTVTRNPHNVAGKVYASSWQHLVVVFNGQLLDPADFYEAKGSKYGMQPDGYVNFTKRNGAGEIELVKNPMNAGEVIAVKTVQRFGHVAIVQHSMNDCGFCQQAMRETDWWNPATFTTENSDVDHYSQAVLNHFERVRQDLYNAWVADYQRATGSSVSRVIDPQPAAAINNTTGAQLQHPRDQPGLHKQQAVPAHMGGDMPAPLSPADRVAARASAVQSTVAKVNERKAANPPPGSTSTYNAANGVTVTTGPAQTTTARVPQAPKGSG
jgi:hypothetical protein